MTLAVFFIAGLFTHQNQARRSRPLAENSLCRITIKVTAAAALNFFPQDPQRRMFRQIPGRASRPCLHGALNRWTHPAIESVTVLLKLLPPGPV
jgi:hypothetical protein